MVAASPLKRLPPAVTTPLNPRCLAHTIPSKKESRAQTRPRARTLGITTEPPREMQASTHARSMPARCTHAAFVRATASVPRITSFDSVVTGTPTAARISRRRPHSHPIHPRPPLPSRNDHPRNPPGPDTRPMRHQNYPPYHPKGEQTPRLAKTTRSKQFLATKAPFGALAGPGTDSLSCANDKSGKVEVDGRLVVVYLIE